MTAKQSGVGEGSRSRFGGAAAVRSLGDAFQPNLAMGGGSYKVPIELPAGPGGMAPQLELQYDTAAGNGPFGLGWALSLPFIERKRPSAFRAEAAAEYTLGGAMPLVATDAGDWVPQVAQQLQRFAFDGSLWTSRTLTLVELRFGSDAASRVESTIDGVPQVQRWLLDRMRFPGGREIAIEYVADGLQRHVKTIRWSVFRLEFEYEDRPDPWSQFDAGFELRTTRRCRRIELHHARLAPHTLIRSIDFDYDSAPFTGTSLLRELQLTGWRHDGADWQPAAMPPLEFGYTSFSPQARHIRRFTASVSPPPALSDDVTLVDLAGTALPGIFRLDANGGTYWENRGGLRFGPPQPLRQLPAGIALSDGGVRFADMEGRGNADLVVGLAHGGGYYPNVPQQGFARKRTVALAPSFDLAEDGSHLVDLDGDRVADLLTFRNGEPLAFFNKGDSRWEGPAVLAASGLPKFIGLDRRLRLAEMNGDGLADVVLLHSRQIVYWPYLGNGTWGAERRMANTPDFGTPQAEDDVFLTDIDGDGAADLVIIGTSEIRLYLNRGGEGFADPIVLARTPRAGVERFLFADMTGSGTAGLLFTSPAGYGAGTTYWYLDLLDGVKPNLLARIDNHAGLVTTVDYSSSAFERTRDLADGRRWSGYLPFVVPVVRRLAMQDQVTGESSVSEFRYHDGHFDGRAREYLGFAEVESTRTNGPEEAPPVQRMHYHTRQTTASDPAFIAGRGQPHRTETLDPITRAVLQLDESEWDAVPVAGTPVDAPAHFAVERLRRSARLEAGAAYESEEVTFEFDAAGNTIGETRRARWSDGSDVAHEDVLRIEMMYATHATFGPTSLPSRVRKIDGAGALLKELRHHYDGEAFIGLPLGQVALGFKTRQTEVALTTREIDAAYGGVVPLLVSTMYRAEADPVFDTLHVHDIGRARVDTFGNEVEAIDSAGLLRRFSFDADALHPVAFAEDGLPEREVAFDPVVQQVARYEDLNGHVTATEYDALGQVTAVYKRDALPLRPTESYRYGRDAVPMSVTQRIRMQPTDVEPGYEKIDYLDGCGRRCQSRLRTEDGRFAVGKQERLSIQGRRLGERDAYFSAGAAFDAAPPLGVAQTQRSYDALGRVVHDTLFNGRQALHRYTRNRVEFFNPDAADALAVDPATAPSRESVTNAGGLVVEVTEREGAARFVVRREHDVMRRRRRVIDPRGNVALDNVFDLWGNHIRIASLDAGVIRFVFDGASREVQRTDADGRMLTTLRDLRGRVTELRDGGHTGPVIETYAYDAGPGANLAGRLARVEGAFGSAAYSYTPEGQAAEITRIVAGVADSFVTRFEYNSHRDVTRVTTPDGSSVDYLHAPNGMLQAIPGFVDAVEYGPTGLRTRIAYANSVETRRRYTPGDYLIDELVTQRIDGSVYQHLVYTLDGVGQALQVDDLSTVAGKVRLNQTYAYDGRNRLVRATGNVAGFDFVYEYDDLGNLVANGETGTRFEMQGGAVSPNRLLRREGAAGVEFEYDASGNMTRDPELATLHYDSRHRLVRIERGDGSVVRYLYDHNDRRLLTTIERPSGTETRVEIEGLYLVDNGTPSRVIFDEQRRLAVVPAAGDALIHHFDRLGNVNVMSNAATGAYVGHDEYTPYGRLFISMVIQPAFTFQGERFTDGLELVLLGARHYRPALGRFLTCDPYLVINQDKIPALHAALNFWAYAYCSPTNFTDPTGEIAPLLVALIVAAIVGAIIGAIGAGINGAKTWDEWLVWIIGGAIGGVLTVLFWYGILIWFGVAAATAAVAAGIITIAGAALGLLTPLLDDSDSGFAWAFSWVIKLIRSPVFTILGLFVVAGFAIAGKRVDFRRGALFVEVGAGGGGLTLGGIVYTQSDHFEASGRVNDDYARHEAYHTRTVAALGEWGFYVTYVTFGSLFAWAQGGPWNALDNRGCGNPFEKHAYTHFNPHNGGPNPSETASDRC